MQPTFDFVGPIKFWQGKDMFDFSNSRWALVAVLVSCATFALHETGVAADGVCDSPGIPPGQTLVGSLNHGVTQRCQRSIGTGVSVSCDINERAISSFCRFIANASTDPSYLLTAGRVTPRTAGCEWSGPVDAMVVAYCKAVGPLRGGVSGGAYTAGAVVP
jgi:hypothetical protein